MKSETSSMDNFWEFLDDDKNLVIIVVFMIAVGSFFAIDDPIEIIQNIVTGLFGIAVGRGLDKKTPATRLKTDAFYKKGD